MSVSNSVDTKKSSKIPEFLRKPNAYVIISILIILATLATWIIPAGQFQRIIDPSTGRTIVDPDTFMYVEDTPVNIFEMLQAIPKGIKESVSIIAFIFIISGSIQIIRGTGALDAGIIKLVNRLKGKDTPLLVVITFLFSMLGAAFGFAEETIPFIPLGVAMAVALGYDRVVGFHMVRTAAFVGFAGAFLNPFTIGVAQNIAELPMFSGLGYRLLCYIVFFTIGITFVIKYARKVRKDPTNSILYGYDGEVPKENLELNKEHAEFTIRHGIVLLIFFVNTVLLVYGVIAYGWYTTELAALFLGFGILAGVAGGLSINDLAKQFTKGTSGVTFGALIVGFARAIVIILEEGTVLDTIIHGLAVPISGVGNVIAIIGMFIVQTLINFFVGSGSGQAAATMPIMVPLSDVIGVTRQSAVLAYQFGDGITNMLYPSMIYYLAFADIPYDRWFKHIIKLVIYLTIAGIILVAGSVMINYGPF